MHRHPRQNPAPLVVRLRDLGPALSHDARARLAVGRIRRAAEDEAIAADRAQATDDLYRLSTAASGPRIEEYTPTAEVDGATFAAQMAAVGLHVSPYRPRLVGAVRHFTQMVTGRTGWAR